jgi:hypothetical protein
MYKSLRPKIPVVFNLKMLIHSFRSEILLFLLLLFGGGEGGGGGEGAHINFGM